ncbi:MAG: PKD domain-containing protein [Bacteroidetes bacterium]|nr:PKD domain-containing protein [Bacteroidota bacterium]
MKTTLSAAFVLCASFIMAAEKTNLKVLADKTSGCSPLEIHFSATTEIENANWKWTFSNGATSSEKNPSIVFLEAGNYDATLTVTTATQSESSTVKVIALASPKVDFRIEKASACVNEPIQFTNESSASVSPIVSYVWGFGDGKTALEANTQHRYKTNGNYNVTLIATDANGCAASKTTLASLEVKPKPIADFIPSTQSGCKETEQISFVNHSLGNKLNYMWSFNDNKTTSEINPSQIFNQGIHQVALAVKDANGCADTLVKKITVANLKVDFSSSKENTCAGENVKFINTSNYRGSNCNWDFGDGTVSNQRNPNKIYSNPGDYTVKFTVKEGECSETSSKVSYIHVTPGNPVSFKSSTTEASCEPVKKVTFENTTSKSALALWEFGDGTVSTEPRAEKVFDKTGNFSVGLTVTDSSGCTITKREENFIQTAKPMARFAVDTLGCIGSAMRFTNMTPNASSYLWSFGDGETATTKSPYHTYKKNGYYTVSLTAFNNESCDSTVTLKNYVHVDNLKIDFDVVATPSQVPPFVCTFKNKNVQPNMKFVWDFGDGTSEASANPVHIYDAPGNFDVRLVGYNKTGCTNSKVIRQSLEMGTSMNSSTNE